MFQRAFTLVRRLFGCPCSCQSCRNGQCGMCLLGPGH